MTEEEILDEILARIAAQKEIDERQKNERA